MLYMGTACVDMYIFVCVYGCAHQCLHLCIMNLQQVVNWIDKGIIHVSGNRMSGFRGLAIEAAPLSEFYMFPYILGYFISSVALLYSVQF